MSKPIEPDDVAAERVRLSLKLQKFYPTLSAAGLRKVFPSSGLFSYAAGETILRQGEASQDLYIVHSGSVKVVRTVGMEVESLAVLDEGEMFGEIAIVKGGFRSASVIASQDSRIYRLCKADVARVLRANPELGRHLRSLAGGRKEPEPEAAGRRPEEFRSPAVPARIVTALLYANAFFLACAAAYMPCLALASAAARQTNPDLGLQHLVAFLAGGARYGVLVAEIGVLILTAPFFLFWVSRIHGNLKALGASPLRFSPVRAVLSYFIPIVNLFRPAKVMSEAWHWSVDPMGARASKGELPVPREVRLWWNLFLGGALLGLFAGGSAERLSGGAMESVLFFIAASGAPAIRLWAALVAIRLVRDISESHDRLNAQVVGKDSRGYHYWAFISYSHSDSSWAEWLHKGLETFETPRRLVGRPSRDGRVPSRLFPVFRDREELPGSPNLGENISEALRLSRYIVVLCSPRSASSRWVNEEVRAFKAMGREDRVLCLILEGEPNASDKPDSGLPECFPEAVRRKVGPDGTITDVPTEPIAADARPGKDGKGAALLKISSGLLAVGYDELAQREKKRRLWRLAQAAAAAVLVGLAFYGVWVVQEARKGGLRSLAILKEAETFAEAGRLRLLADDLPSAAVYLSAAYSLGLRTPALRLMLRPALAFLGMNQVSEMEWDFLGVPVFSPDKTVMALRSSAGVEIRDARQGTLLHRLEHPFRVLRTEFSPDGAYLITGGVSPEREARWTPTGTIPDKTFLWDAKAGKMLRRLDEESWTPGGVFSENGETFVTFSILPAAKDGRGASVWDSASGRKISSIGGRDVRTAVLQPHYWVAGTAGPDGGFQLWDFRDGTLVGSLDWEPRVFSSELWHFVFLRRGLDAALLANGDAVRIWSWKNGKSGTLTFDEVKREVLAAAVNASGSFAALATHEEIGFWSLEDGIFRRRLGKSLRSARTHRLRFIEDAGSIEGISVLDEENGELWDPTSGRRVSRIPADGKRILGAGPRSDGSLAASYNDGKLRLWNVGWLPLPQRFGGANVGNPRAFAFSPDGKLIAAAFSKGSLAVWNLGDSSLAAKFESAGDPGAKPDTRFSRLAFSPDGTRLAARVSTNTVRLYDLVRGEQTAELGPFPEEISSVAFGPAGLVVTGESPLVKMDGKYLEKSIALYGEDSKKIASLECPCEWIGPDRKGFVTLHEGVAEFWMSASTSPVARVAMDEAEIIGGIIDDSGATLALQHLPGEGVSVWDVRKSTRLAKLPGHLFALSRDGTRLIVGDDSGPSVFDADGRPVSKLEGARNYDFQVNIIFWDAPHISPDGTLAAAATEEGVKIWEVETGKLLLRFGPEKISGKKIGFSADGARIAFLPDFSESVWVWDLLAELPPPDRVAAHVKERVPLRLVEGKLVPLNSSDGP